MLNGEANLSPKKDALPMKAINTNAKAIWT